MCASLESVHSFVVSRWGCTARVIRGASVEGEEKEEEEEEEKLRVR